MCEGVRVCVFVYSRGCMVWCVRDCECVFIVASIDLNFAGYGKGQKWISHGSVWKSSLFFHIFVNISF